MMLLSFTASNHKSLRDPAVLNLTKRSLRTLRPTQGASWAECMYTVAGIFGPNASGKTTLIDALQYAVAAVQSSATSWQALETMPYAPFALDDEHPGKVSRYEFDFVVGDVRHEYGFEVSSRGVEREWLKDLPSSRWRTLINRQPDTAPRLHPSLQHFGRVTRRELVLSRAILLEHPQLATIGNSILEGIDVVPFGDAHREVRLGSITQALKDQTLTLGSIETLLKIADIGITEVTLREDKLPPEMLEITRKIQEILQNHQNDDSDDKPHLEITSEASDAVIRSLEFAHRGAGSKPTRFSLAQESSGTIAWLAIVIPAIDVLRDGGVLCVDEIDASLHSHLVDALIGFFLDPAVNNSGAQLIFTSHDTNLLSPASSVKLDPDQVWFTEKERDGSSSLYSLAEFPRHEDANVARRYLSGRYGAVPDTAPHIIQQVLRGGRQKTETI